MHSSVFANQSNMPLTTVSSIPSNPYESVNVGFAIVITQGQTSFDSRADNLSVKYDSALIAVYIQGHEQRRDVIGDGICVVFDGFDDASDIRRAAGARNHLQQTSLTWLKRLS